MFEIVQLWFPVRISRPVTETPPVPKKSNTLFPSMRLSRFTVLLLVVVPSPQIALTGRLPPAGPMLFAEIVLLLLPTMVVPTVGDVLKRMVPPAVAPTVTVEDPWIEEFLTTLFWAPLIKRMVLVPAVADTVVLEIVSEFPPEFLPSMVTKSAPFKSINGLPATIAPETVRVPLGVIVIEV